MPNLADVIKDVQAFYGVTREQAEALVDRLTPVVLLQTIDARFSVIRADRSYWTSQARAPATVGEQSMIWLFNLANSGVDVIVHRLRIGIEAPQVYDVGRVPNDETFVATGTSVPMDPRNPASSSARLRTGVPSPVVFVGANRWFNPADAGNGQYFDHPVPVLIEPGNSWAVQTLQQNLALDGVWEWEERTQLVR